MPFAPTITGYPNKIGFTGKIYPEHLVLNQDLQDFEYYRETVGPHPENHLFQYTLNS